MLKMKEKKELEKKGKRISNLAKAGNHMAQTVIGISNELHLQSVKNVQTKLNDFDDEQF